MKDELSNPSTADGAWSTLFSAQLADLTRGVTSSSLTNRDGILKKRYRCSFSHITARPFACDITAYRHSP